MRIKLYRGKFYAVWRENGATRRMSLRTSDPAEAQRQLADIQKIPQGNTVADIFSAYEKEKADRASHDRMLSAWKRLKPHFGALRPDQVTRGQCKTYIRDRRSRNVRDGTIHKELGVLRAALKWADPKTPAQFEFPPKPAPKERYLTRKEFDRLLGGCASHHVKLFVLLALSTAGRQSAILDLTWDRVDFERGLVSLAIPDDHGRRKGRATVPMTEALRAALKEAHKGALTPQVIEYAGEPVRSIKHAFNRACERAGLEGVTPHTLRHTAAVWLAESGVPMPEIARYLGHSDSRITEQVYAKFSPDYLRKAASALEV